MQLICGIWRLDGTDVVPAQLQAMIDAMRPAGKPVAFDIALAGPAGMAVIAIGPNPDTPPPPPIVLRTRGDGLLAADVRLYDGSDRAAQPGILMARIQTTDDAQLANLHGDFAYAHWHNGQILTMGRDRFGARPLQYTVRAGAYAAFASLPAALLRTGLASRALDEASIASFPVNEQSLPGRTYFRDIGSVRAAHLATVDAGGNIDQRRYWRLPLESALPIDTDPAQAAAEIRRLLDQAVRRRLPQTGPAAAHMSGGLDSTPIAVLAARALQADNRTCLAYSYQESKVSGDVVVVDEAPFVEAAAAAPNLRLTPIIAGSDFSVIDQGLDPDTMLPLATDDAEETVLRDAASHGAGIILSGWGGDQIVTSWGTGHCHELLRAGRWRAVWRELASQQARTGSPRWRQLASMLLHTMMPARLVPYYHRIRSGQPWVKRLRFTTAEKRVLAAFEARPRHPDSRANRRSEMEAWWIPYRLEMFAQQGARHGIAYAYPMLDHDLIAYAMRLPGCLYRRDGVPRRLIRDAIEGIVPESVRWREEKYAAFPLEALRIANERDTILTRLQALAAQPLVNTYLDMDALQAELRAWPTADEIRTYITTEAAAGRQASFNIAHWGALRLAYFLKTQHDLDAQQV